MPFVDIYNGRKKKVRAKFHIKEEEKGKGFTIIIEDGVASLKVVVEVDLESEDASNIVVHYKGPVLVDLKVATILILDDAHALINTARSPEPSIVKPIRTNLPEEGREGLEHFESSN